MTKRIKPCSPGLLWRHRWVERERSFGADGVFWAKWCVRCKRWYDEVEIR